MRYKEGKCYVGVMKLMLYIDHSMGTQALSERLNVSLTLSTGFLDLSILPYLVSCISICSFTTVATALKRTIDSFYIIS